MTARLVSSIAVAGRAGLLSFCLTSAALLGLG
jgi:hypothetical protein